MPEHPGGEISEAIREYERAVAEAARQGQTDGSLAISITRYFIGNLYLIADDPPAALAAIAPSIARRPDNQPLLRSIEAESYWRLGQKERARASAETSLSESRSETQRHQLAVRLAHILE